MTPTDKESTQDKSKTTTDSTDPDLNEWWSGFYNADLGETLFRYRDYTPIPLVILLLFTAEPSVLSATLGTLVIVAGELWRLYSVAFIGSISRTRKDSTGGKLVTEGPFAIVRNPLYLGNFLITLGAMIYGSVFWVLLLTVLLFAFQYGAIVKYEDKILRKKFGKEYDKYRESTPAWLPQKLPDEIEWPSAESLGSALRSEKNTFIAIAILLIALGLTSK